MMLINVDTIFKDAVLEENIDTLEKILSSSDNRIDLIEEFSKENDIEMLTILIPKFKSKGLISSLEDYCSLATNRINKKKINTNFESSVIKFIHYKNKEENRLKHLKEDSFEKRVS